jgi:hypothetical protein
MLICLDRWDRLVTAADVAELLSPPVSWLREHTRSGRIDELIPQEIADLVAQLYAAGLKPSYIRKIVQATASDVLADALSLTRSRPPTVLPR